MNARFVRVLFVCLLIVANPPGVLAAQDATTVAPYVTVSGQDLAWSAPWTFVEDDAMLTSDLDLVFLTDGSATVAVSTGDIHPENARGLVIGFLGGDTNVLEVIDAGAGASTSYWFDQFPVDDEPFGAFSTATTVSPAVSVLVMFIGPVASFGEGMASAQGAITLDGQALFPNVDGMALQAQLGVPANPTDDAALPEFVAEGQWVDRTYDVQVMWEDTWFVLRTEGEHTIHLGMAESTAMLTVTVMPREGTTPQQWADEQVRGRDDNWGTYTYLPQYVGENEVLTIGLHTSGEGGIMQEVLFLDDGETVVTVGMALLEGDLLNIAGLYRDTVRIDGRVPMEDVDLATMAAEMDSGGLSAEGLYASPQYGIELEWDPATWEPWPSLGDAAFSDPVQRSDGFMLASRTEADVSLVVFMGSTEGLDLSGFVTYNAEPDISSANYGDGVTLLKTVVEGDRAANVFQSTADTGPMLIYETYELAKDGNVMVVIVYMAPAPTIAQTLPAAQNALTLEGEPVLDILTVEELMALFGQ
jgi:hypothetical protein